MTIKTLEDLPLIKDFTTPITEATKQFYLDTLAKGSGPNGLVLVKDFFGESTGGIASEDIITVAALLRKQLAAGTLSTLPAIYANMKGSVNGSFGTSPVVIPSGPGAGSYANANAAIAALVALAEPAISAAAAAMGGDTATINSAFSEPAAATVSEQEFQTDAGIVFDDLTEDTLTPVLALISSVPSLGTSDALGRPSQFFESVLDKESVAGQALIAAMREGQNSLELNSVGINGYNIIPARDPTESA
jgi:hypothetical protein